MSVFRIKVLFCAFLVAFLVFLAFIPKQEQRLSVIRTDTEVYELKEKLLYLNIGDVLILSKSEGRVIEVHKVISPQGRSTFEEGMVRISNFNDMVDEEKMISSYLGYYLKGGSVVVVPRRRTSGLAPLLRRAADGLQKE